MRNQITVLAAAGLLLVGCGSSTATEPEEASSAGSIPISGQVELFGDGNVTQIAQGAGVPPGCSGLGGYDDLRLGAPVLITDQAGAVVGTGTVDEVETPSGRICWLRFTVDAPAGLPFYGIAVGAREPVVFTAEQVTELVALSIGR